MNFAELDFSNASTEIHKTREAAKTANLFEAELESHTQLAWIAKDLGLDKKVSTSAQLAEITASAYKASLAGMLPNSF